MQITIHDIAFGGKGVGRAEGLVVFVPFTIPGEEVSVQITRKKEELRRGRLISVDTTIPAARATTVSLFWSLRRLFLPAHRLPGPAHDQSRAGRTNPAARRQTGRGADATDDPLTQAIRLPEPDSRPCLQRRHRILHRRLEYVDGHPAMPHRICERSMNDSRDCAPAPCPTGTTRSLNGAKKGFSNKPTMRWPARCSALVEASSPRADH